MFDIVWIYDIFILEIWHIFSIIFSVVFLTYIYLNARKSLLLYYYIALHSILLVWLIAKIFKTIAPTADIKWNFIVAQYFAVCFLGSVFLMFAYIYARGRHLSLTASILINIPPAFFFLIVLTNNRHHLFYSTYNFLGDTFGPFFYAYMICTYIYLIAGIYLCSSCFKKQFNNKGRGVKLFVAGIIFPLFVNVLYVSGITEPRFDITPVTTNISLLFFAYAIYRYQFLNIVPLGILLSLNKLQEGILIVNNSGDILYSNDALQQIIKNSKYDDKCNTIIDIDSRLEKLSGKREVVSRLIKKINNSNIKKQAELFFPGSQGRYFILNLKVLPGYRGSQKKYLFVFSDVTTYRNLISSLEEKINQLKTANQKTIRYKSDLKRLALIEERNRIAGEIHDVLGHSLTLILNILESSYILMDIDKHKAIKKIKTALSEARTGKTEMHHLYRREEGKKVKTIKQLKLVLESLADKFRSTGMKVKLNIIGSHNNIKPQHYFTIFRINQEALTNSLKHGRAEKVNILIRFNKQVIDLYILDDGQGCKVIKKGNGLKGMKQRMEKFAGSISYGSPEGKGFTIHAKFPI